MILDISEKSKKINMTPLSFLWTRISEKIDFIDWTKLSCNYLYPYYQTLHPLIAY